VRRLIWLAVLAFGGGGIFYAAHPYAKECEALVKTANVAVQAANNYQDGQPIGQLIATFNDTADKLTTLSAKVHAPFDSDAEAEASSLRSIVNDLESANLVGFESDVAAYNQQATSTNSDCRHASSNVDG
jgi:hypothetical protein